MFKRNSLFNWAKFLSSLTREEGQQLVCPYNVHWTWRAVQVRCSKGVVSPSVCTKVLKQRLSEALSKWNNHFFGSMQAVGRWMRRSCACYLTLVLGQKWANWHKLNSQVCKYVQSVTSMSRWGSTQTSAQWNTTTMTRVRVSLKTRFCHFLFSKASVFVPS